MVLFLLACLFEEFLPFSFEILAGARAGDNSLGLADLFCATVAKLVTDILGKLASPLYGYDSEIMVHASRAQGGIPICIHTRRDDL